MMAISPCKKKWSPNTKSHFNPNTPLRKVRWLLIRASTIGVCVLACWATDTGRLLDRGYHCPHPSTHLQRPYPMKISTYTSIRLTADCPRYMPAPSSQRIATTVKEPLPTGLPTFCVASSVCQTGHYLPMPVDCVTYGYPRPDAKSERLQS